MKRSHWLLKPNDGVNAKTMPLFSQFAEYSEWVCENKKRLMRLYNRTVCGRIDYGIKNLRGNDADDMDKYHIDYLKKKAAG